MTPMIIGASVQGESHIRHAIEKQDSYRIVCGTKEKEGEDIRIVAVADGHGSASCPYSRTGSKEAVDVFCDIMAELTTEYKEDMLSLFAALHREGETAKLSQHIVREWSRRILKIHEENSRMTPECGEDEEAAREAIFKQYGTTLLGMLVTGQFLFAFQLGDGDIMYTDADHVMPVVEGEHILGVETHSISRPDSWKKVLTNVISLDNGIQEPCMYVLSTDGWINSHASDEDFYSTCRGYFHMIQEHGTCVVEKNLPAWLSETSAMGCGDDITTVFVYYGKE